MGVTFLGQISHPALCSVPFHWRGMCYAHQFSREGPLCVREAAETARESSTWPTRVRCSSIGKISAARVRRCSGIDRWPFARHSLHSTKGGGDVSV
jgi:hypothetical protein